MIWFTLFFECIILFITAPLGPIQPMRFIVSAAIMS